MHLVDTILLTELIKLTEETRQQINDVLWLCVLRELCKANHVCVEQGHIIKTVNDSLIVLDSCKHMQGYQLAQQFFGLLHLNLNDPLLVVLSTSLHFSSVRGQDQQDEEDKLEDTINYVGLQIDFILGDEEEILVNHTDVEYELNEEEDAEGNRS